MGVIRTTSFWRNVSPLSIACVVGFDADLLADGFFLDQNESDCIYLDDIVFRDIASPDKQEELWMNQYYGYVL